MECKDSCVCKLVCILVLVGALNWGLVGLAYFGGVSNGNVVNILLGSWPVVENIVYVLVGLSAIVKATSMGKCKAPGGA